MLSYKAYQGKDKFYIYYQITGGEIYSWKGIAHELNIDSQLFLDTCKKFNGYKSDFGIRFDSKEDILSCLACFKMFK